MKLKLRGFTLIELLIVVAIIAILAAIAVPNFLEAQTRSKVSRIAADLRSLRTGLEAYRVDDNAYPETDLGATAPNQVGFGLFRITTPVSYMTSIPKSPFRETEMGGDPNRHCRLFNQVLYARAAPAQGAPNNATPDGNSDGYDDNYQNDRIRYMALNAGVAQNMAVWRSGFWMMKSVGPDNDDDYNTLGLGARPYDPTNGTISDGDLVVFSDSQGFVRGGK